MISGFVMASKNEKMSKSKSNSTSDPMLLIDNYSADVVRYYGGIGKLGLDLYMIKICLIEEEN